MTRYVECVPNFSEGTGQEVIAAIRDAVASGEGAKVLDVSADPWHNRSVITYISPVESAVATAFLAIRKSLELIDINAHLGVHPRIGAADVFPFVPLGGGTMQECAQIARDLGARVGSELQVPVYLYERAALKPGRTNLALIRKHVLARASRSLATDEPRSNTNWSPDFGPSALHGTFGAMAIGARPLLVAYNIYLGGADNMRVARQVAAAVRESGGGVPGIKALAFLVDGQAQLSMNLFDLERTSMQDAFEAVRSAATARGAEITWTEIVGLAPQRMIEGTSPEHLRLIRSPESRILERHWPAGVRL